MKIKTRLAAWLGMALMAIAGTAFGADPQLAKEQVVRYGSQYADIGSLDPHFATIGSDMSILNCIYNGAGSVS